MKFLCKRRFVLEKVEFENLSRRYLTRRIQSLLEKISSHAFHLFLHVEYRVHYGISQSRQIFKLDFLENKGFNEQILFSLFDTFSHVESPLPVDWRRPLRRVAGHPVGWKIFYANVRAKSRTFFFRSVIPRRGSVRARVSVRMRACECVRAGNAGAVARLPLFMSPGRHCVITGPRTCGTRSTGLRPRESGCAYTGGTTRCLHSRRQTL